MSQSEGEPMRPIFDESMNDESMNDESINDEGFIGSLVGSSLVVWEEDSSLFTSLVRMWAWPWWRLIQVRISMAAARELLRWVTMR